MGTIGTSDKCQWNHKDIWRDRESNPDLPVQNPVVLPTVRWEPLEWNFWQMPVKSWKYLPRQRLGPGPSAGEPCCPNPTAVICFSLRRVGNFGLKKEEKRPYWKNSFSCILQMRRKITSRWFAAEKTERRSDWTGTIFAQLINFDQLLQTVKNRTTVLILVFRVFTNINSTTNFCNFC